LTRYFQLHHQVHGLLAQITSSCDIFQKAMPTNMWLRWSRIGLSGWHLDRQVQLDRLPILVDFLVAVPHCNGLIWLLLTTCGVWLILGVDTAVAILYTDCVYGSDCRRGMTMCGKPRQNRNRWSSFIHKRYWVTYRRDFDRRTSRTS
jgi:hypothetical protein